MEQRRILMRAWANYLDSLKDGVIKPQRKLA